MLFSELIKQLIEETTQKSLWLFGPELILSACIVLLLLVRLFSADRFLSPRFVALFCAVGASVVAWLQFSSLAGGASPDMAVFSEPVEFFTGLLVYDHFTVFFRIFLLLFLVLVIALTILSGIPDLEDSPDFYSLLIGSTIGMMLMSSANHLLILFLGVEMTSVPSYAMVGFLKGRKSSSEAALKYVVYGAGAAGVMLYGISLIAGLLGTGDLPEIAARMAMVASASGSDAAAIGIGTGSVRVAMFGLMLVLVGLAFKLSLVPFHFWCPDAFEGASAEVAGFLSVASKAGAFALLIRVCLAFVGSDPGALRDVYLYVGIGIGAVGALSATFGNLAAYTQTNVKRLLAYSTIAHAGYMVMAVAALMVILNAPADAGINVLDRKDLASQCMEGLLYYLTVYLFMNLGAFAVVALIRNQIFSEDVSDYNGLAGKAPYLCVGMAICMFSLVGLPPFGGFFGKLMIFSSLFQAGSIHWSMWLFLVLGGLNTVFSLFYYLKVLQAMFLRPREEGARDVAVDGVSRGYVMLVAIPVVLLGGLSLPYLSIAGGLSATARTVAEQLLQ